MYIYIYISHIKRIYGVITVVKKKKNKLHDAAYKITMLEAWQLRNHHGSRLIHRQDPQNLIVAW